MRILCGITTNKGWWPELERGRSTKEAESTGLQDSLLGVEKSGNKSSAWLGCQGWEAPFAREETGRGGGLGCA